ncbi:hypothetical protein [Scytonema millei]|uniref:Uncharacterized protein n=1 Tax=Scytonema millei VB511283 TaxID=1245923 RepID=A0A9X5I6U8_9CYAN|nr:hypothetical protein [Scytonema millei]NHC36902.1 hypothetical protein [Scytonema millei VB511283]
MSDVVFPFYIRIYERRGTMWSAKSGTPFYNGTDKPMPRENIERYFKLTPLQVVIELFRINGGRAGFYIANLRDRKYYYCGAEWDDVKTTLHKIGIGRPDPFDTAKG